VKQRTTLRPAVEVSAVMSRMHLSFCTTFPGVAEFYERIHRDRSGRLLWGHLQGGWEAVLVYARQRVAEARSKGGAA
jgi:hypothetical protein